MTYPVPPSSEPRSLRRLVPLLVFLVGVMLIVQFWQMFGRRLPIAMLDPSAQPRPIAPAGDLAADEKATIALFKQSSRSVVHITTLAAARDFGFNLVEVPQGTGSGFIWDEKGHIVTNHHVVKDAESIAVTLKDGRQVEGRVVGSDAGTDIALIKIQPQGLSALKLGNSDDLKVGDVVLAIGNPFGLGQTVTSGIVSALGRSGHSSEAYEDFIQTDAPINPGNSGGALINSKGELIGVNSAILAPSGGNVGIGFAVPVNMMKAVVAQLEKYGAVRRGRIGVTLQTVTPDVAAAMGLARAMGAIIGMVMRSQIWWVGMPLTAAASSRDGSIARKAASIMKAAAGTSTRPCSAAIQGRL